MNNLVYQYWNGDLMPGIHFSVENIKNWCNVIGADHLFEHNQNWASGLGKYTPHYGAFKVCYEKEFEKYDNILYLDCDVYAVDGLRESIFDDFIEDIAIAREPFQPKNRKKMNGHPISNANDERFLKAIKKDFGVDLPRTSDGLPEVFNSGVVMYSKHGREIVKNDFMPFKKYADYIKSSGLPDFYASDQGYLHAMIFIHKMNVKILDSDWNALLHGYYADGTKRTILKINDPRNENTKLVHIQLGSADHWSKEVLNKIVNSPYNEWDQLYKDKKNIDLIP